MVRGTVCKPGTLRRALPEIRRARDLDPLSPVVNAQIGWILYLARRYDEAIQVLRKSVQTDPDFDLAEGDLGLAYQEKGMYGEAIAALEKSDPTGNRPDRMVWLALAHARAGHRDTARHLRARLEEEYQDNRVTPSSMALLDLALGEPGQSMARLEQACTEHRQDFLSPAPVYDPLRTAARFEKVVRCLGAADVPIRR